MSIEESKGFSGTSLSIVPILKDDGSNWWDFIRRLEEALTMAGFADTMQQSQEPYCPAPPIEPHNPTPEQRAQYAALQAEYLPMKASYDKRLATWIEKQSRVCMAVRSKCEYLNFSKVKERTRVYQMLDILKAGRETGSGKLMELTTRFYSLYLADCTSVADFSAQLLRINQELQDLHPSTAFSNVQLILRFLQGLGLAWEGWISNLTQYAVLIASPGYPAITFDSVVHKAYNEEKLQSSAIASASRTGTALLAHGASRPSGIVDHCTHCNKSRHTEAKCFLKHPHLKKEFDEKRKNRDKKRKRTSDDRGDFKRSKSTTSSTGSGETVDTGAVMVNCVAIDNFISGNIAPPPLSADQALSLPAQPLQNEWIVDTGCTNHVTGLLSHFTELKKGDYGTCGGVGGSVRFEGIGTVEIPIPGSNGRSTTLRLSNVKYCPSMGPFNLISVSQLFKNKKARPVLTEDTIHWTVGQIKINATAKHGLWLLDRLD
jgi:hypothetical protein